MFERIKRLYQTGKLSADGVRNAVTKGWITQEECDIILSDDTMISYYVELVSHGDMQIADVPSKYRSRVASYVGE